MTRSTNRLAIALTIAFMAFLAPARVGAAEPQSPPQPPETNEPQEQKLEADVARELRKRRASMLDEAGDALEETHLALESLDQGKSEEALAALARATGKLELIVARDPGLALAPVDMQIMTHDLYASPEAIRSARADAMQLLRDGRIQDARKLLAGLASETVISITNLPLASYPNAIKAVSPLIDAGENQEAMRSLRAALGTLVVTRHVIPLPTMRAQYMLQQAEQLLADAEAQEVDLQDRTGRVQELVAKADEQLEMASLLGYGAQADVAELQEKIAELHREIGVDEETTGLFASLQKSLGELQASFFASETEAHRSDSRNMP